MIDLRFRRVEIAIVAIYLLIGVITLLLSYKATGNYGFAPILLYGLAASISITAEHKIQLIFNRYANKFTIVEKALFIDDYRVNNQYRLEDVMGATVHSYWYRSKNGSRRKYSLRINIRGEGEINPFKSSSSGGGVLTGYAEQINNFLAGSESSMTIAEAPFAGRIFGLVFSFYYFTACYRAIFN